VVNVSHEVVRFVGKDGHKIMEFIFDSCQIYVLPPACSPSGSIVYQLKTLVPEQSLCSLLHNQYHPTRLNKNLQTRYAHPLESLPLRPHMGLLIRRDGDRRQRD